MLVLTNTSISFVAQINLSGLETTSNLKQKLPINMNKRKQIITRCIAILMLSGIVLLGGYVLYVSFRDIDKPVPMVTKTDSIGRPFEINGYMFYLRNDTLYD